MEGRGIQGVILDADLLFDGGISLEPRIKTVLDRLFYSDLHQGILVNYGGGSKKEMLVNLTASWPMLIIGNSEHDGLNTALEKFISEWAMSANSCLFVTSSLPAVLLDGLLSQGWHICLTSGRTSSQGAVTVRHINCIEDIFYQIASINKAICHEVFVVAYTMKWSREVDLIKRGAFPFSPTKQHLSFFPLNLYLPLPQQLENVDIVLYKPTDEIMNVNLGETVHMQDQFTFSDSMQQLIRFLKRRPHICVIDPIEKIFPLLDRALTQNILQGISECIASTSLTIRTPHFLKVAKYDNPDLSEMLKASKIALPAIVKPQMACGVPNAHKMAVVFKLEGFHQLDVPTPSTIQEYIDHGSRQYKFYVLGSKVFYSVRKSTPNARKLYAAPGELHVPAAVVFDSLKSLPTTFASDDSGMPPAACNDNDELDLDLVHAAATWLKEKLNITIFGFDVVVEVGTRDHVIVDVNFFPTFKDVNKEQSIPAFWDALYMAYRSHIEASGAPAEFK